MRIENVRDFVNTETEIYVLFNDSKFLDSVIHNQTQELTETGSRIFIYHNKPIVLNDKNQQIFPNIPVLNEVENTFISEIENDTIYYYKKTQPQRTRGFFFLDKKFELTGNNVIKLYGNLVVVYNSEVVCLYNLLMEELWRFQLSDLKQIISKGNKNDSVKQLLGVAHDNFWFSTESHKIIALDIKKGIINFETIGYGVFLHPVNKNVYSIGSNKLIVINTSILEQTESYIYFEADPTGIGKYARIYSPLLQGDYFTFLAEMPGDTGGIRHAGVFDYRIKKLIWEAEIISKEDCQKNRNQLVAPNPLYMSGDRLFVKDIKNTLHIFQKE